MKNKQQKIVDSFKSIRYYDENDELHREDGPAVEWENGYKGWFKNGNRHRENGPAIEYADGYKYYYYNGIFYPEIKTDEEWIRFVKLMVFL